MKQIPLTQDKFALVDDEDFDWLNQWKWRCGAGTCGEYAVRTQWVEGQNKTVYMHREVIGAPQGMEGDHKDRNTLNNQRYNLREATRKQNSMNRGSNRETTSKFKGVGWHKAAKKWRVYIKVNGDQLSLGYFDSEIEAAQAYNVAATKYHGEFAGLNAI